MTEMDAERKALLIGVPRYDVIEPDLPCVTNDLSIMRNALESSRFNVHQLGTEDTGIPTRNTIHRTIHHFCANADESSTLLLYFSGHGIHYNNRDYVLPSDATLDDPTNVVDYLIPIDLHRVFGECRAQTILFFIDACREGLKIKNSSKELAEGLMSDRWSEGDIRLIKDRESAIVFSCGAHEQSWVPEGSDYSLFTKALADVLDAKHSARKFKEITGALQDRLDDLATQYKLPSQTVKVYTEFDGKFQLLERTISDGPRTAETPANQAEKTRVRDTHEPIDVNHFLENSGNHGNQSIFAAVLFADLFGSTEFQLNHDEHEAVSKMARHNRIASDVITEHRGIVAKHIGDRVMGVFGGTDCENQAVSTGIAIIRRLEEENKSQELQFPNDLKTSIGITSGRLWKLRFEGCDIEDYAGLTVDIAARLCSLAGLGQLVCDDDTFQRIQFRDSGWSCSQRVERFVEGHDDPLPVRLVVPKGLLSDAETIPLSGYSRPIPGAAGTKLEGARRLFREKRFDEAFTLYREILDVDRGSFEANVRCAEIVLHRLSGGGADRSGALSEAIHEYLCIAKQIRPQANLVWRLLGWAYYLLAVDARDISLLSTASERTQMALSCAQDYMDENGEAQAKVLLALILREEARLDTNRHDNLLLRANEHCGEVANQVASSLDRTRSDHLAVHALVQADMGALAPTVEKMLDQAKTADPKNPRVHEAFAEFYRTGGHSQR